jgi:hypothetical protein
MAGIKSEILVSGIVWDTPHTLSLARINREMGESLRGVACNVPMIDEIKIQI